MQIEYTGRQTEVPPALRRLAERRLRKLERALGPLTHVHVIFTADKHRQIAEVTLHSAHVTLTATGASGDLNASLSTVMDKLTRQAQRHLGRLRERRRRPPSRAAVPEEAGDGREAPRLIRSRRFVMKPMTLEEAMLEVQASAQGLLVFRDSRTERMGVLFRRKDGNLGLIEPEA